MEQFSIEAIAHIKTPFRQKFGIPRQAGLAGVPGEIVFTRPFRNKDAIRGIETHSHLWLIWIFDRHEPQNSRNFQPLVTPPRLKGERLGVFATRSPLRPNMLGMSVVKLEEIDFHSTNGPIIRVSGVDILDGTVIVDIKPYLQTDLVGEAHSKLFANPPKQTLTVLCDFSLEEALEAAREEAINKSGIGSGSAAQQYQSVKAIASKKINFVHVAQVIKSLISFDPRPWYHQDPNRVYGLAYDFWDIKFTVDDVKGRAYIKTVDYGFPVID